MHEGTILFSFVAGLISFLSPCVLPLIPGFISYLAGTASQGKTPEPGQPPAGPSRKDTFLASVYFVLGFASVFALLGVLLNTALEAIAFDVQEWLSRIGGVIVIFFGLYLTGLIKIRFLEAEHRLRVKTTFSSRFWSAFIFGAAFAVGWSPCVGAVLGGILALAATQPGLAFWLLLSYAIGFGVPFLIVGAFTAQANNAIRRFGKWLKPINILFGLLLVVLGVLIFTQTLSRYANFEILNNLLYDL